MAIRKDKSIIIPDMYGDDLEVKDSLNAEREGIGIKSVTTNEAVFIGREGALDLIEILQHFIEYGTTRDLKNM